MSTEDYMNVVCANVYCMKKVASMRTQGSGLLSFAPKVIGAACQYPER
jgi:hypothetical protein